MLTFNWKIFWYLIVRNAVWFLWVRPWQLYADCAMECGSSTNVKGFLLTLATLAEFIEREGGKGRLNVYTNNTNIKWETQKITVFHLLYKIHKNLSAKGISYVKWSAVICYLDVWRLRPDTVSLITANPYPYMHVYCDEVADSCHIFYAVKFSLYISIRGNKKKTSMNFKFFKVSLAGGERWSEL